MLDIPTATTRGPRAGTRTPEQRERFLANKAAKEASGASVANPGGPGMTSLDTAPKTENPWMSYNEYYADNPEAQKYSMYHPSAGYVEDPSRWVGGVDPYSYGMEYNKYKEGLPLVYQDLINYGVSPESVASGQVHSLARGTTTEKIPTDPAEAMSIYGSTRNAAVGAPGGPTTASGPLPGNVGSGSYHTIAPEVMNRMWR
jgi:hypothetical protein